VPMGWKTAFPKKAASPRTRVAYTRAMQWSMEGRETMRLQARHVHATRPVSSMRRRDARIAHRSSSNTSVMSMASVRDITQYTLTVMGRLQSDPIGHQAEPWSSTLLLHPERIPLMSLKKSITKGIQNLT
jgi:hypothetical protein